MNAGIFAFNADTAVSVKGGLGTVATDLSSSLADLDNFVTKVAADWDGDEKDTYQVTYHQWKTNATQVQQILDGVSQALGSVNEGVGKMRDNVRASLKEDG